MRRITLVLVAGALLLPAASEAANPIVAAAKRTAGAKSVTLSFRATSTIAGRTTTVTGSGARRGNDSMFTMRSREAGHLVKLDAIVVNEHGSPVVYTRAPFLGLKLPPGKTWLRIDQAKQRRTGFDLSPFLLFPQGFTQLENGIVSTRRIGRESVAGHAATRYRAVIDVNAVPAYRKQLASIGKALGTARLDKVLSDVWIGGDGRIRQIRLAVHMVLGGVRATSTQTMTFLSFDRPISIAAPPASQVYSEP